MAIMGGTGRKAEVFAVRRWVGGLVFLALFLAASSLVLGASQWDGAAGGASVKVGLVPTESGVGDLSFNWMAYQGLVRAESDLGVAGSVYTPTGPLDYGPMLQQCVDDGNQLCIAVGFTMADATWTAADDNPGVNFAIVDVTWDSYPTNLRGMGFAQEQIGYLAGTLAGLMTESDVAGAVGGMQIAPVEAFLEPYGYGAGCANPEVTVIITYTGTFTDAELGALVAQAQMGQGADVVFGVGGLTGNGAILTATQSGAWGIGVDADQWLTLFGSGTVPGSEKLLTSAMKRVDNAVYDTIADAAGDAFTAGTVLYDLAVDGVGLAPFHEADAAVPQPVRDALEAVRQGIVDGSVDVWASCQIERVYLPVVVRNH